MRTLLPVAVLLALSGCAHVGMQSWQGNKFTLCGNRWADGDDFKEAAHNQCGGPARAIAGGIQNTGDAYVQYNQWGGGEIIQQRQACVVYECGSVAKEKASLPPPPQLDEPLKIPEPIKQ